VKWLTPVKPEKNACPASTLFQCSLIGSDAAAAAADQKATPPPLMKNARRAAGHKTTQRRRRPPVRRRTALICVALHYTQRKFRNHVRSIKNPTAENN